MSFDDVRGVEPETGLVHAFRWDDGLNSWFSWCNFYLVMNWTRWRRATSNDAVTCVYCATKLPQ